LSDNWQKPFTNYIQKINKISRNLNIDTKVRKIIAIPKTRARTQNHHNLTHHRAEPAIRQNHRYGQPQGKTEWGGSIHNNLQCTPGYPAKYQY
jgi:hypothetical protein